MRTLRLISCVAVSALLAATPALGQEQPQDPPANPADSTPTAPLIDDAGPLPDVGDAEDFGREGEVLAAEDAPVFVPAPMDDEGRSIYGLFLAGRLAMGLGQGALGSAYLADGYRLSPDDARLKDQAFTAALLSGDLDLAARIAPPVGAGTAIAVEAGRLVAVVRDFGHGRARQAHAALTVAPIGFPHARAGLLVQPWIAAAAGDWDRALAAPPAAVDPIAVAFGRYNRALLLEIRRDHAGAQAQYDEILADARTAPLFRLSYGIFLERRGRRADALAYYDGLIAEGADWSIRDARARVAARKRPPAVMTLEQGAALGLSSAAAAALAEQASEFAVVYLRLALDLDPKDETRVLLAQALAASNMNTAARGVLAEVTDQDPRVYAAAQHTLAWSLSEAGQSDAAVQAARQSVAARPDDPSMLYGLASLLMGEDRYDEALDVLGRPAINTEEQPWPVRFLRGAAYESLGRAEEAEAELWAALQEQPDNAELLNYLGYLWVDSGTRVDQGAEMIARAVVAQPENGHFQDSLGWAQYRQGRFEEAVRTLEIAIGLTPTSAEITDHLGDAYWQVGRRREAGFQWTRVLTMDDADDDQRARAQAKLDGGLEAATRGARP